MKFHQSLLWGTSVCIKLTYRAEGEGTDRSMRDTTAITVESLYPACMMILP